MTLIRRTVAVVVALALPAVALAACAPDDDGLADAVDELAAAVGTGDVAGFAEAAEQLAAYPAEVTAGEPVREGDTATVDLTVTREVDGNEWSYQVPAELTLDAEADAGWSVAETPQLIADGLEEGETIEVSREYPERAGIIGADGREIVTTRPVTRYGLDKSWVEPDQVESSAREIAEALDVDPDEFAGRAAQMGDAAFVEAIVLRPEDAAGRVPDDYASIPGANAVEDAMFLGPTSGFAGDLLGTVGEATAEAIEESDGAIRAGEVVGLSGLQAAYDEQLRGTPAVTVSAISGDGDEGRTLIEWAAAPAAPLVTTLDIGTQMAADEALEEVGSGASLVAIRPSTGAVLAAANSHETEVFSAATLGQYAPGSTFKVVTALALLRGGLSPDDAVSCADAVTVDGYEFHNYGGYPAAATGDITLREAVANSCNTAMISSRDRIDGVALQQAAASLGLGTGAELGFPAFLGDVPLPEGETEYAADTIGQGRVLASPLAMATVAASVAAQETVQPHLIEAASNEAAAASGSADGAEAEAAAGPGAPLTEDEAKTLHSLMRSVVTEGSASALGDIRPEVAAKTGTAEYGEPDEGGDLPTHAWMIATQGDLAVAVFVEGGDSGAGVAGPIVADFLGRI